LEPGVAAWQRKILTLRHRAIYPAITATITPVRQGRRDSPGSIVVVACHPMECIRMLGIRMIPEHVVMLGVDTVPERIAGQRPHW
jgi:hypothetical protein